jgi:multicomponent Na+:H+ antiporter subunit A
VNIPWATGVVISLTAILSAAAVAPSLRRILPRRAEWVLGLAPLTALVCILGAAGAVMDGTPQRVQWEWAPSLGLALSFQLDGLSLLFAALITGIGTLILLYGGAYLRDHDAVGRFDCLILFFMGSMLGLVLADNLILLFVFWELTSIASYLLIGFNHSDPETRQSALRALLVTAGGGLALLAGLLLLGIEANSFERADLLLIHDTLVASPLYIPILLLVLIGVFTKSAQVPFHFWLPDAMKAPTPASAYLHSATMVKAGLVLLAKLSPILGGTPIWHYLLSSFGVVTMATGALLALMQTDLKRLLAYSTISALGTLVLLLGIGTTLAVQAMLVFLLVHALYKASLFMVAGAVDKTTGTREVPALSGLWRKMPQVALAAALAGFSMSGLPPLIGFISKELLYEAKIQAPTAGWPILVLGVIANAANVAVALKVGLSPFIVRSGTSPSQAKPVSRFSIWFAPLLLAVAGLFLGLFPNLYANTILPAAIESITQESIEVKLKLWHGINPVLLLSVATVALGATIFLLRNRSWEIGRRFESRPDRHLNVLFDRALSSVLSMALRATRFMQNGKLTHYVRIVVFTVAVLGCLTLLKSGWQLSFPLLTPISLPQLGTVDAILAAALLVATTRSRLAAVIALGVVGYGVAIIYAMNGAPDLAITQLLVETLTVIIFSLILLKLPRFETQAPRRTRLVNASIAGAAGTVITLFVLKAVLVTDHDPISGFMADNSYTLAFGRNVVNVILVDFRAMDTLGEIVVLATAALGVRALLYRSSPLKKPDHRNPRA